jgi:hypothetical protein
MLCGPGALAQNLGEWGSRVSLDPDRTIGINTPPNDVPDRGNQWIQESICRASFGNVERGR